MDMQGAAAVAAIIGAVALYLIRVEMRGDITRLDGRINTHEKGCEERQKRIDGRLASIDRNTERMDKKLDQLMGLGQ